jgi:ribosome biogenesis protein BRX1
MGKKRQRQNSTDDSSSDDEPATIRRSEEEEPEPKKSKWTNKQRVLVFGCRGLSYRDRHLVKNEVFNEFVRKSFIFLADFDWSLDI